MSYYSHDQATFDKIKAQIEDCREKQHEMNGWEMNFISDMALKLQKHGRDISFTDKQTEKLEDIHGKYCGDGEERVRDTTDGFRELENRDKGRRFR